MKELLNFVVWKWQKWEFWQRCFVGSLAFYVASVFAPTPYSIYLSAVPMAVVFGFMLKWWVWDQSAKAWNDYKAEKKELFTTIKDSEKA